MVKKERRALLECSWTKHFREIKRKRRGEVERKEVRKRKTEGGREGGRERAMFGRVERVDKNCLEMINLDPFVVQTVQCLVPVFPSRLFLPWSVQISYLVLRPYHLALVPAFAKYLPLVYLRLKGSRRHSFSV